MLKINAWVALWLAAAGTSAQATLIDFSDQPVAQQTVVASPFVAGGATFSSPVGLRVLTATGFYDRALCPHTIFACVGILTIDFASPVNGLSFDVYQIDTTALLTLNITSGGTVTTRSLTLPEGIGPRRVSLDGLTAITRLSMDGTTDEEGYLYDNFNFTVGGAAAVPEPASWALLLTGFGLAGTAIRRRRAATAEGGLLE